MEGIINHVSVGDKECNGSKRHDRDIMVTLRVDGDEEFHDFFLTTEQAEKLIGELQKKLEFNKS